jgi:hypothetical protein
MVKPEENEETKLKAIFNHVQWATIEKLRQNLQVEVVDAKNKIFKIRGLSGETKFHSFYEALGNLTRLEILTTPKQEDYPIRIKYFESQEYFGKIDFFLCKCI